MNIFSSYTVDGTSCIYNIFSLSKWILGCGSPVYHCHHLSANVARGTERIMSLSFLPDRRLIWFVISVVFMESSNISEGKEMDEGKAKDQESTAAVYTREIKSLKSKVMEMGLMYDLWPDHQGWKMRWILPGIGNIVFALRDRQQLPLHFSWSVFVSERAACWCVSLALRVQPSHEDGGHCKHSKVKWNKAMRRSWWIWKGEWMDRRDWW